MVFVGLALNICSTIPSLLAEFSFVKMYEENIFLTKVYPRKKTCRKKIDKLPDADFQWQISAEHLLVVAVVGAFGLYLKSN